MKARQWLRHKTLSGSKIHFYIMAVHGGIAGSLVGLGYIHRAGADYILTRKGSRWIGVEPLPDCPA